MGIPLRMDTKMKLNFINYNAFFCSNYNAFSIVKAYFFIFQACNLRKGVHRIIYLLYISAPVFHCYRHLQPIFKEIYQREISVSHPGHR